MVSGTALGKLWAIVSSIVVVCPVMTSMVVEEEAGTPLEGNRRAKMLLPPFPPVNTTQHVNSAPRGWKLTPPIKRVFLQTHLKHGALVSPVHQESVRVCREAKVVVGS